MGRQKKEAAPDYDDLFFSKADKFLNVYLAKQAGRSEHTRKQYRTGLSQFYDFISDVKGMSPLRFCFGDVTYDLLLDYSQHMQKTLLYKPSTVNARLAGLREYLRYVSDGDASRLPCFILASRVPNLTVPAVRRPLIEKDDLKVLLDSPGHTRLGNRDSFILVLLYDTAVRVGELVSIRLGDISFDGDRISILINGKGRKQRSVTLSASASEHMKGYLDAFHEKPLDPGMPLLYTKIHGQVGPMSARNIERILNKYGKVAKETNPSTPDSVYPHMMRRCRATYLYQDNVPIEQIAVLLGHSQAETTRAHYAFESDEQMKEISNKAVKEEPDAEKEWEGQEDEIKRRFGLK